MDEAKRIEINTRLLKWLGFEAQFYKSDWSNDYWQVTCSFGSPVTSEGFNTEAESWAVAPDLFEPDNAKLREEIRNKILESGYEIDQYKGFCEITLVNPSMATVADADCETNIDAFLLAADGLVRWLEGQQ